MREVLGETIVQNDNEPAGFGRGEGEMYQT